MLLSSSGFINGCTRFHIMQFPRGSNPFNYPPSVELDDDIEDSASYSVGATGGAYSWDFTRLRKKQDVNASIRRKLEKRYTKLECSPHLEEKVGRRFFNQPSQPPAFSPPPVPLRAGSRRLRSSNAGGEGAADTAHDGKAQMRSRAALPREREVAAGSMASTRTGNVMQGNRPNSKSVSPTRTAVTPPSSMASSEGPIRRSLDTVFDEPEEDMSSANSVKPERSCLHLPQSPIQNVNLDRGMESTWEIVPADLAEVFGILSLDDNDLKDDTTLCAPSMDTDLTNSTLLNSWIVTPREENPAARLALGGIDSDDMEDVLERSEDAGGMSFLVIKDSGGVFGVLHTGFTENTNTSLPAQTQLGGGESSGSSRGQVRNDNSPENRRPKRTFDQSGDGDDDREDDENGGDGKGGRGPPRGNAVGAKRPREAQPTYYICPFFAGDPTNEDYHKCKLVKLKDKHKVKSHCKNHLKLFKSDVCWHRAGKKDDRDKHDKRFHASGKQRDECPQVDAGLPRKFDEAHALALEINEAYNWSAVFKAIFPKWTGDRPPSKHPRQPSSDAEPGNVNKGKNKETEVDQLLRGIGTGAHANNDGTEQCGMPSAEEMKAFIIEKIGYQGWEELLTRKMSGLDAQANYVPELGIYPNVTTQPRAIQPRRTVVPPEPSPGNRSFSSTYAISHTGSAMAGYPDDRLVDDPSPNRRAKRSTFSNEESIVEENHDFMDMFVNPDMYEKEVGYEVLPNQAAFPQSQGGLPQDRNGFPSGSQS